MRRWTKVIAGLGCATAAFVGLSTFQLDEAEACLGPPPSDCGVAINCALVTPHTGVTDEANTIDGEFQASVFLTQAASHPACDQVAFGVPATFELQGRCGEFGEEQEDYVLTGATSYETTVGTGLNRVDLNMDLDPGPQRQCILEGDITIAIEPPLWMQRLLGIGTINVNTACNEQIKCLGNPSPDDSSKAAVSVDLINEQAIIPTHAGHANILRYEVSNNSNHTFHGIFQANSANVESETEMEDFPDEPLPEYDHEAVCAGAVVDEPDEEDKADCSDAGYDPVCGCDQVTYPNSCEMENAGVELFHDEDCIAIGATPQTYTVAMPEGDVFPIAFRDETPGSTTGNPSECIPLPDNPAAFTQPSIQRQMEIPAGQSEIIEIVQRSWTGCLDGSCSAVSVMVSGAAGQPVAACAGSTLVVNEGGLGGAPSSGSPTLVECDIDSGPTTPPEAWNSDEPKWEVPEDEDSTENGVPDYIEEIYGYDPLDPTEPENPEDYTWEALLERDTTGNGVPDAVEIAFGYDPLDPDTPADPENYTKEALMGRDTSENGVSDYEEIYIYGSDPTSADDPIFFWPYTTIDTNGNGVPDYIEIIYGYDPLDADTPSSPEDYSWESLLERDTTQNGVPDAVEIAYGYDPHDASTPADPSNYTEEALQNRDTDGDGLTDFEEIYEYQTDPLNADTDGDGYADGWEVDREFDPLDPTDPPFAPYSNSAEAGIIFASDDEYATTLVRTTGSQSNNADVLDTRATGLELNAQIGRIHETMEIDANSVGSGGTIDLVIPFDIGPLLEDSPYEVNRLQMGEKALAASDAGTYIGAKGKIRLSSSPFTIFETMYRLGVSAINPVTGVEQRLSLSNVDFLSDDDQLTVLVSVEVPSYGVDELILHHDWNASEMLAYKEICDDGVDNTGNGKVDCDDPYCADDPACADENGGGDAGPIFGDDTGVPGGDDVGTGGPGGGSSGQDGQSQTQADSGCGGCAATGSGQPLGLVVMVMIGFAFISRRRVVQTFREMVKS